MPTKYLRVPVQLTADNRLTGSAIRLYCHLHRRGAGSRSKGIAVAITELQAELQLCPWSVSQRIAELERYGYLEVQRERGGRINRYRLILPEVGPQC